MTDNNAPAAKPAAKPSPVRMVEVTESHAGQRVDNFLLREVKGAPRSLIYRWLRKGEVRVNKKRSKPTQKLHVGDQVRIPPVRLGASDGKPAEPPRGMVAALQAGIVYEDDAVVVLNKPSGIAAHGGTGIPFGVIEALRTVRPEGLELVHRLDRETSGLMLLAKTRPSLLNLQAQLQQSGDGHESAEKYYFTLVAGRWQGAKTVSANLQRGREAETLESQTMVDADGKVALSHFKPLSDYTGFTTMEVRIDTGRMHQIRVHAAHEGHPVAGDSKYGDRELNKRLKKLGLKRLFLHAHRIVFTHPVTAERLMFGAELPDDLREILDTL